MVASAGPLNELQGRDGSYVEDGGSAEDQSEIAANDAPRRGKETPNPLDANPNPQTTHHKTNDDPREFALFGDRRAQGLMAIFAGLGLLVGIATIWLIKRTVDAQRAATAHALSAAEAGWAAAAATEKAIAGYERPLLFPVFRPTVREHVDRFELHAAIEVTNYGRVPAVLKGVHATPRCELFAIPRPEEPFSPARPGFPYDGHRTVERGEPFTVQSGYFGPRPDGLHLALASESETPILVEGSILYYDMFQAIHYRRHFSFQVLRSGFREFGGSERNYEVVEK